MGLLKDLLSPLTLEDLVRANGRKSAKPLWEDGIICKDDGS